MDFPRPQAFMDGRFAFTAQFWGDRAAVVCRAREDSPGPIVEPQFGEFPSWTRAHAFASKLNEGLDLDPVQVRQIVTSSLLASACVMQEALNSGSGWLESGGTIVEASATQIRFVLSELALALTFCRVAHTLSRIPLLRGLLQARETLKHSAHFLKSFGGDVPELAEIASRAETLDESLRGFLPSLTSVSSPRLA